MLIAAGLSAEVLVFRDARKARWSHGLEEMTAIVCDAFTARHSGLPKKPHIIISAVLAAAAAAELLGREPSARL
jgi:hypothetical protein